MNPGSVSEQAIDLFKKGRLADALRLLDESLEQGPAEPALLELKGRLLQSAKRFDEALACYDSALAQGEQAEIWNERGALLSNMARLDESLASYDRAVAARPYYADAFYNRGNALRLLRRDDEAVASFDQALAINPGFIQAWNNRGSALLELGRNEEAVASFDRVLAIHPGVAESWNNRANALAALGQLEEALQSYDRAVALDGNFDRAWDNRGTLLRAMGRGNEALASHERALAINPQLAEAWFNRGNVLQEQRRLDAALDSYDRALAFTPNDARAWSNRGIVLRQMKMIPLALASYSKSLEIRPDDAGTLYSRGIAAWVENADYEAALRDLARAVQLDPDTPYAQGGLLLVQQYGADWRDFAARVARVDEGIRAGKPVTEPFLYQAVSQSPADLQICSVIHANKRYPAQTPMAPARRKPGEIRIGYVSGEFREQATAYLMAGLYECHDKARFEITAFDNGGNDHSPMRARLEAAFNRFVDISRLSDRDAAARIAADDIDILVNLNGYFGDYRMGIFAHHPAPVQVNYLGFPATLGAPYMDYIIADATVIPEDDKRFYTEQVVWLPDSYQVNDLRRPIAPAGLTRAQCGLPGKGFVFCNFNAGYKLTPDTFAGWMRILKRVPAGVLWLLEGNAHFTENLRREAEAQGVAAARLIFAPMMEQAEHLARLGLADLFLDALPYNAHTTASDALWAGVPLLTNRGTAFAGRVAASLLKATGLAELVTETTHDYESLAVELAGNAPRLQALRQKLAAHRHTMPLFDTDRFRRNLEAAYDTMLTRWQQGLPAEGFAVTGSETSGVGTSGAAKPATGDNL